VGNRLRSDRSGSAHDATGVARGLADGLGLLAAIGEVTFRLVAGGAGDGAIGAHPRVEKESLHTALLWARSKGAK
jgi:hypothetical protein